MKEVILLITDSYFSWKLFFFINVNDIKSRLLSLYDLMDGSIILILGMCISITEADATRISMHSQRYDTLKIHMRELAIRFTPVTVQFDFDSIQHNVIPCNTMQWKKYDCIYFYGSDRERIIN